MQSAATQPADMVAHLGLKPDDGDLFVGKRVGFPIGLKFIGTTDSLLLLFQVRLVSAPEENDLNRIRYSPEVSKLIDEKKLEIDFDNRIVWLSFPNAAELIASNEIPRLLDSVLASFSSAGLLRKPDLCHYCQREKVQFPSSIDGKVVQICGSCFRERTADQEQDRASATAGALPIALLTPASAAVGALGWALFWTGYDLLFDLLNTQVIIIPRILEFVALICVAAATGGPVGFVIKRIRRRGRNLSATFAVLWTLLAAAAGEVFYVAWAVFREVKVFSLSASLEILPRLELELGGFHLAIRIVALACAVAIAVELAKPPKPKLIV